jgi:hypothetical protein
VTTASVNVLVYVPAKLLPGTNTPTVGVAVNLPRPVFAAALKNFTAVGGVAAAGTATGYVTELVGLVHVPDAHEEVTLVSEEALVARVCVPVVNWVEVIVAFQPAPVPRVSVTLNAAV